MNYSYNKIALIFDTVDKIFFRLTKNNPRKVLKSLIPDEKKSVIDICTGTGSNIIELAKEKPNLEITGIDNSQGMINVGISKAKKYNLKNVKFILQDAADMDITANNYDYAVISLILHEMDDNTAYKTLKNTYKILKDNGKLIVFEFITPKSNKLLPKIAFKLVKKVEDKTLFPAFLEKNKEKYFKDNGFVISKTHIFQYTIIYELNKIPVS